MADAQRALIEQRSPVTAQANGNLPQRQTVIAPAQKAAPAYPPKLAKAILGVTRGINPVAKQGWNEFHKYAYRKFEDVFEELVPLINQHGIIIEQTEIGRTGFEKDLIAITYSFTLISEDGDVWPTQPELTAICKIRDAKGIIDDKAASKCNTQAQKYFYTSFFKIRTVDTSDADHDAGGAPKRRAVPSPDGKTPPHMISIVDGEAPAAWGRRFCEHIAKATSKNEIDDWYSENSKIFEKLKQHDEAVYNSILDYMDAREGKLAAPAEQKADPISSGKQEETGDFPGDKPMKATAVVDASIPLKLDRQLTEPEQEWLLACDESFAQCTDTDSLMAEQESVMMPSKDAVSDHAWARAVAITKAHLERIQGG